MLPKNKLNKEWLNHLHVFRNYDHNFKNFLPNVKFNKKLNILFTWNMF